MPIIIAKKWFVFNRAGIVWAYYISTKLQTLSLIGLWLLLLLLQLQLYVWFFILSIFPPARTRSLGTTFLNGKIICEKCVFLLVCLAFQMQPVQLRSPLTYSASTWNNVMCVFVCVCARAFVIRKYKRISFMLSFWLVEKVDIHIGMKEIEIKTDNNTNNNTKRRQQQRQSPKKKIKIIQNIYIQAKTHSHLDIFIFEIFLLARFHRWIWLSCWANWINWRLTWKRSWTPKKCIYILHPAHIKQMKTCWN